MVGPSAILRRLGLRGNGLYALRGFRRGDCVGRYSGSVAWSGPVAYDSGNVNHVRAVRNAGSRYLLRAHLPSRPPGRRYVLIDGSRNQRQPQLANINDARGTGLRANVRFTDAGWCDVSAARVRPFRHHPTDAVAANAEAELRVDYGDGYWVGSPGAVAATGPFLRRNLRQSADVPNRTPFRAVFDRDPAIARRY